MPHEKTIPHKTCTYLLVRGPTKGFTMSCTIALDEKRIPTSKFSFPSLLSATRSRGSTSLSHFQPVKVDDPALPVSPD